MGPFSEVIVSPVVQHCYLIRLTNLVYLTRLKGYRYIYQSHFPYLKVVIVLFFFYTIFSIKYNIYSYRTNSSSLHFRGLFPSSALIKTAYPATGFRIARPAETSGSLLCQTAGTPQETGGEQSPRPSSRCRRHHQTPPSSQRADCTAAFVAIVLHLLIEHTEFCGEI